MSRAIDFVRPTSRFDFRVKELPICDGGVGFVDIMCSARSGSLIFSPCFDPLNRPVSAKWGYVSPSKTAILEVAETGGYNLLTDSERNPVRTTSFGGGENIKAAVQNGSETILIGCGDTAITDCGIGMLSALGVDLKDENGARIDVPVGGDLERIHSIDASNCILNDFQGEIVVACNLSSIARGPSSTALVYSQQKGASLQEANSLAGGIEKFCRLTESLTGKSGLGLMPGSGSAGGIGFALAAFANRCILRYSFDAVFSEIDVAHHLKWADVVITGEGLFDKNSIKGKAPVAIALKSKRYGTNAIGIVGSIQSGIHSKILRSGFDLLEPMSDAKVDLDNYIANFETLLFDATVRALMKFEGSRNGF
jgi:glycerate kinase